MVSIFSLPIFSEFILPFVLVFVLIFAILDKTKILGDDKRQINAIVALVIALIAISFSSATNFVVKLMPFLAVIAVILLVFYVLFGFATGGDESFVYHKGLKIAFGIIIGLALIIAILMISGSTDFIIELLKGDTSGKILGNALFVIVIIAAVAVALWSGGSGGSGSGGRSG